MSNMKSFRVYYDRDFGVLYVTHVDIAAARGVEDKNGVIWRYDVHGTLIGATVLDVFDRWHEDRSTLTRALSEKFQISAPQANRVLDHAFGEEGK